MSTESAKLRRSHVDGLRSIADTLLDGDASEGELRDGANLFFEICRQIAQLEDSNPQSSAHDESTLAVGKAVSAVDAARCALDYRRTVQFLCGIETAIRTRLRLHPDAPVHVLYAGCGPFATLVLPLLTFFTPAELQVTMIDVHPTSIDSVRRLSESLACDDHVVDVVLADAATFRVPARPAVDILVVETMQRALSKEPQVAITRNLLRQLPEDATLIPECVSVNACLAVLGAETRAFVDGSELPERVHLGPVFELSRATVRGWDSPDRSDAVLPGGIVVFPRDAGPSEDVVLTTAIRVYREIGLGDRQSGLTQPLRLSNVPTAKGTELAFGYRIGPQTGLDYAVRQSMSRSGP